MYQVGDQVVYGTMGICQVMDITLRSLPGSGEERPYYTLKPLYQDCLIHVPVDTPVSIRPAMGRRQAEALIDSIPTIHPVPFHSRTPSQISEHYAEALRSHDCSQLVGLTMSIYAKKQEALAHRRKISSVDQRYMKQGEDLLFGELAAALGIPREEVPRYIASRVASLTTGKS
jgi:CarD family transcriptional regulator